MILFLSSLFLFRALQKNKMDSNVGSCPICKKPDATDFFYESKYAEDKTHQGWRCLSCREPMYDPKFIIELDCELAKVKIECISMDMQASGELTRENSSHEEMSNLALCRCADEKRFDEQFIIQVLQELSQGVSDE